MNQLQLKKWDVNETLVKTADFSKRAGEVFHDETGANKEVATLVFAGLSLLAMAVLKSDN